MSRDRFERHGDLPYYTATSYSSFRYWERHGFCTVCQTQLEWDGEEEDFLCNCMSSTT